MPGGRIKMIVKGTAKHVNDLRPKTAKAVRAIVRKEIRKLPERKHFGFQGENEQLDHNKCFYQPNWLKCKQGVKDPDDLVDQLVRVGDEFYLRNINIKYWLSNKLDRPNCMYRCILFWYDSNITLSDAYCFFTQTNKMLDRPNNENISVIDEKYVFSGPMYLNGTEKFEHSYLCTLRGNWKNKKITYDEGGSVPKKRTLGSLVVVYDAYGTLQTDNIASFAYNGTVCIQDP